MKLRISDELSLPIDAITKTYAVLGIRGSGKTNTAVDVVEEIIKAGHVAAIIDPLDVWYGLRSSRDGKSYGLKVYIFGGSHADVPLESTGGELVARFIVENRVPTILSLKHLRKGEQTRFVTDYCEALYHLNKEPLFQVIDECARFIPQRVMPDMARCVGAVADLYSEGRASGIGGALIGQRSSRINKDVLTQCDVLVTMRTQGPQDRKALEEWVDAHGTDEQKRIFMREIASMPTGTGYFWDPVEDIFKKIRFRERETFDSSVTPKVGKPVVKPKAYASIDVGLLREKMAATVERAKAEDPKALRSELAAAKKKIAELEARPAPKPEIQRVVVPCVDPGIMARLHSMVELANMTLEAAKNISTPSTRNVDGRSAAASGRRTPDLQKSVGGVRTAAAEQDSPRRGVPTNGNPAIAGNGKIGGAPARMLQALAAFPGGIMTRRQLAIAATVPVRTSTFRNAISILKTSAYIRVGGDEICITDLGRVNMPAGAVDQRSVVETWRAKFGGVTLRMLDALLEEPDGMSRAQLADRAGVDVTTSTFRNGLSLIKNAGAAIVERDHVRADESLLV